MNTKVILATLAGSIFAFLAGYLIYGILLMDYFAGLSSDGYRTIMKDPPILWAIFLANVTSSYLLAMIFSRWANIKSFGAGFMAALTIGFLMSLSYDLMFYATSDMYNSRRAYAIDVVIGSLFTGLMGGVIGAVLGMGKKEATQ